MFNILRVTLILLFMVSNHVGAADSFSACGNIDGVVTPGDPTICKEDKAVSLLKGVFPKIYDEVLELTNLEDHTVSDAVGERKDTRSDIVFERVYLLFWDLATWLFGIYLIIYALDIAGKKIRGEPLYENSGGSWNIAKGIVIGSSLLIPYKTFFSGQLFIFALSAAALGSSNILLSVFLHAQQTQIEAAWSSTLESSPKFKPAWIEDRHHFYARAMYNHLVQMELCRKVSSDFQMAAVPSSVDNYKDALRYRGCAYGTTKNVKLNKLANTSNSMIINGAKKHGDAPAFVSVDVSAVGRAVSTSFSHSELSTVTFGVNPENSNKCEFENIAPSAFSCGTISITHPQWELNPFVKLIGLSKINKIVDGVSSGFSGDMSGEDVHYLTFSGWEKLEQLAQDQLELWTPDIVHSIDDTIEKTMEKRAEEKSARELVRFKNNEPLRQLASFYHLSVMNAVTVGKIEIQNPLIDVQAVVSGEYPVFEERLSDASSLAPLLFHFDKSKNLADDIEEMQCFMYNYSLHDSEKVLPYLSGDHETISGKYQFRCVDYENLIVVGLQEPSEADDVRRERLVNLYNTKVSEFKVSMENNIVKMASHRRGVEKSMSSAIASVRGENIWVRIRQEGFLSMATYMFALNTEMEMNAEHVSYLVNNLDVSSVNADQHMISNDLKYSFEKNEWMFPWYNEGLNALSTVGIEFSTVDSLVDRQDWIRIALDNKRQAIIRTGGVSEIESMLGGIFDINNKVNNLGIDNGTKDGYQERCLADPRECPFPTKDPFLELTQLGHTLVNTSAGFFSVYFAVKGITATSALRGKAGDVSKKIFDKFSKLNKQTGSVSNNGMLKSVGGLFGKGFKMVSDTFGLMDKVMGALMSSLGLVMVLLFIIGVFLAYVLPLIPYLYIYLNFVAWVMVVFMASFSVFLWAMYWTRFQENKDMLLRSMYHYGGQILLKPVLSLTSLLFAWYFFYAASFFIGMTLGGFLNSSGGDNWIADIYHSLFKWFIVVVVYFYALKYIMGSIDDMTSDMLSKLGIEEKSSKDRVNDIIKLVLYEKAEDFTQKMVSRMGKDKSEAEKKHDKVAKAIDDLEKRSQES
jgi:hypothetical protein